MVLKLSVILGAVALAVAYPVSYPEQAQAPQQRIQAAQPQYRYVQQPAPALYQPQAAAQQAAYQPQQYQPVAYQPQAQAYQPQAQAYQPQALQPQRPRKLRPVAAAAAQAPLESDDPDYDPNPTPYQFSFDVRDDLSTNYQNRKEEREGDKITGSYSVVDSDGFIRTVKYTADPIEGFKAEVTREPTDIKIVIPTPPPAQLSARQQQTQQYLEAAPQYQPAPQQYARRPAVAAARAPARSQYAEQSNDAQPQYAAAPVQHAQYSAARPGKTAAYFAPQQAAQYQGYAQQ